MLRTTVSLCLLALLAAPLASARAHTAWWFWLSKPERHGSRKMPGDFRPSYASYRYHSRERRGFFSFLHFGARKPGVTYRRQAGSPSHAAPHHSRTTL